MDIAKVLSELRQELENLDAAIWTLERLQQNAPRRRGRPPKALAHLGQLALNRAGETEAEGTAEAAAVPEKPARTARRRP